MIDRNNALNTKFMYELLFMPLIIYLLSTIIEAVYPNALVNNIYILSSFYEIHF